MKYNEIRKGAIYKAILPIQTRTQGEHKDVQETELCVRILNYPTQKGEVEVVFPPFNTIRWIAISYLYPMED